MDAIKLQQFKEEASSVDLSLNNDQGEQKVDVSEEKVEPSAAERNIITILIPNVDPTKPKLIHQLIPSIHFCNHVLPMMSLICLLYNPSIWYDIDDRIIVIRLIFQLNGGVLTVMLNAFAINLR